MRLTANRLTDVHSKIFLCLPFKISDEERRGKERREERVGEEGELKGKKV